MKKLRYSEIAAVPDTAKERDRIDAAARAADARWELARAAAGRMSDAEALERAARQGWAAERFHGCKRSKTRRAVAIVPVCRVWTTVRRLAIPGLGSGRSLDNPVSGPTWEKAFRAAAIAARLRERALSRVPIQARRPRAR